MPIRLALLVDIWYCWSINLQLGVQKHMTVIHQGNFWRGPIADKLHAEKICTGVAGVFGFFGLIGLVGSLS